MNKFNNYMKTVIYVMSATTLILFAAVLATYITNNNHFGATCEARHFQSWIQSKIVHSEKQKAGAYKPNQYTIVSIVQDKLQPSNARTHCSGYVSDGKGNYSEWSGWVADTDVGVVGNVVVR